jgi:hypothetical protein
MIHIRISILSTVLLMFVAMTSAFAQNQTPPQPPAKSAATLLTKLEDVSKWTKQQWYAAETKWSKEKAKWTDCRMQAAKKKLSGRQGWPFLYECMTSSS